MLSLTIDGIDLSDYGLRLTSIDMPYRNATDTAQAEGRTWGFTTRPQARSFTLGVSVVADTGAALAGYLDDINAVMVDRGDRQVILGPLPDRYWTCRIESWAGRRLSPVEWAGQLVLVAHDPYAYSTDYESVIDDVIAGEWSEVVAVGGTAYAYPVVTLTFDSDYPEEASITLRNATLEMEIEWAGSLDPADVLVFDSEAETVTLNGDAAMTGVSGDNPRWPLLKPGANLIEIEGFTGHISIEWRERYL